VPFEKVRLKLLGDFLATKTLIRNIWDLRDINGYRDFWDLHQFSSRSG
jgi:hypothetical protein